MKLYLSIFFCTVFFLQSCISYLKPSEITVKKPERLTAFEDAYMQLDTILKDSFKKEVKCLPTEIAAIKLEYKLGRYLLDKWKLNYKLEKSNNDLIRFESRASSIMQPFFRSNVKEPSIILRIIFRCYHKHLNNIPINLDDEIQYYKNKLGQYSLNIKTRTESYKIRKEIRDIEDLILDKYMLSFVELGDTLGFSAGDYKSSFTCLVTGKLIGLDLKREEAQLFIFDIACSNRNSFAFKNDITIHQFDTISVPLIDCFTLNYRYPTYGKWNPLRWNKYINQKYFK